MQGKSEVGLVTTLKYPSAKRQKGSAFGTPREVRGRI
jgi:hypothetical protein